MKKSLIFLVIIGLLFSTCKKIIVKRHTFEGVLYHDDNYEPMTNIPLQLILTDGSCEFGCNTYEVLKQTTTDDKGYFKFNYAHQLKDGKLKLEMKGNEQYQDEHIASGIEKNQDVSMPFFRNAAAYVKIRFNILKENTANDTLFCAFVPLDWNQKQIEYNYGDSVNKINCSIKPIENRPQLITNSFKVAFDQNYEFNGIKKRFLYGIGIDNFKSILSKDGEYKVSEEYLTPKMFPDTTIIDVDIH